MDERNKNSQSRILSILVDGDKEALIDELCEAIKWARELNPQDWAQVCGIYGSLRAFVSRTVDTALEKDLKAKEAES